ncbi:hypothetical protein QR680_004679 [Steinernema hermaphroditum]|uniref:Uncharacterized protein n=1 Tax=Steinernema hermaphroditum TaxID=289476 RepID=A0AA39LUD0_9BILA|nr:hypothetical protein QR680_004679 [Steinernema hermaphroditum]
MNGISRLFCESVLDHLEIADLRSLSELTRGSWSISASYYIRNRKSFDFHFNPVTEPNEWRHCFYDKVRNRRCFGDDLKRGMPNLDQVQRVVIGECSALFPQPPGATYKFVSSDDVPAMIDFVLRRLTGRKGMLLLLGQLGPPFSNNILKILSERDFHPTILIIKHVNEASNVFLMKRLKHAIPLECLHLMGSWDANMSRAVINFALYGDHNNLFIRFHRCVPMIFNGRLFERFFEYCGVGQLKLKVRISCHKSWFENFGYPHYLEDGSISYNNVAKHRRVTVNFLNEAGTEVAFSNCAIHETMEKFPME